MEIALPEIVTKFNLKNCETNSNGNGLILGCSCYCCCQLID